MIYNYDELVAGSLPETVDMPPGLAEDVKYVFSVTYTDPYSMSTEDFSEAAANAIAKGYSSLGTYPPPQGHEGLRGLISDSLSDSRGADVSIDNIFLASGAGGACQTLIDTFVDPGDVVLLDEYCYHGSLNMLLKKGAQLEHVKMDDSGMDADLLDVAINQHLAEGTKPKLIYTIPVYQNPTGITMSLDRRYKMLDLSHKYGIPIIENESYADFRIDGPELPPAMIGLDEAEGVMYISAFTKLLGCGLRLGFCAFPESARDSLSRANFGVSPSHLSSMVVYEYLKGFKDGYVEEVRSSLRRKRDAMLSALGEYFPPTCSWSAPSGGMMIWVTLPEGANTWDALDRSVKRGVKYNPGSVFRADRDAANRLRLTYSHNTPDEINDGISILADVFHDEGFFN